MLIIDIDIAPEKYNDNDPDQFRMYRELSIKERRRLGERIKKLEATIARDTIYPNRQKKK